MGHTATAIIGTGVTCPTIQIPRPSSPTLRRRRQPCSRTASSWESAPDARRTAHEWWPTAGLHGELSVELPLPAHFEQATTDVTEEQVAAQIVCGPDPERHLEAIETYRAAGFDHVYLHQVGPDQEGFLRFCAEQLLPALA